MSQVDAAYRVREEAQRRYEETHFVVGATVWRVVDDVLQEGTVCSVVRVDLRDGGAAVSASGRPLFRYTARFGPRGIGSPVDIEQLSEHTFFAKKSDAAEAGIRKLQRRLDRLEEEKSALLARQAAVRAEVECA